MPRCDGQCRVGLVVGTELSNYRRAHVHDKTTSWIALETALVKASAPEPIRCA